MIVMSRLSVSEYSLTALRWWRAVDLVEQHMKSRRADSDFPPSLFSATLPTIDKCDGVSYFPIWVVV